MIRPATAADIPAILEIFDIARSFMRQNGNFSQWTGAYPGEPDVVADIAMGEAFVIEEDGAFCAAFTLLSRTEPTYAVIEDGAWLQNGPYGTIHRVASNGKCRGVVRKAVDFALQYHKVLRCDTHADNLPMQRALTNAGFVYCGTVFMADNTPRRAYEYIGPVAESKR